MARTDCTGEMGWFAPAQVQAFRSWPVKRVIQRAVPDPDADTLTAAAHACHNQAARWTVPPSACVT
jgi:hypothetical protein